MAVPAVPYASAAPIVTAYGDALTGKIIVDVSNPFDPTHTGSFPDDSSATQQLAKVAPAGAHVVKAFNPLFGHVLAADQVGGRPPDVFIAGDDVEAKARVASFIDSLALLPLDVGDLKMAHWLEGVGLLMMAALFANAVEDSHLGLGINVTAVWICLWLSTPKTTSM
ncbi:MAG: NADPH-dependent F420 reductase [Acidimicrobiales bacterium]